MTTRPTPQLNPSGLSPSKRLAAAAIAAVVLLAAACGSSSAGVDTASSAEPTSDTPATSETAAQEPAGEAANPQPEPTAPTIAMEQSDSPVENMLGIPIFDDAAMQKWFSELSREAEIVVATCMLSQGFEYTPVQAGVSTTNGELDIESREYAEARGFNIVADFNESAFDPATATLDANDEYLQTLSPGERDAYFVALAGVVESEYVGNADFEQQGCRGQSVDEVFSIAGVLDAIAPVFDSYYDLYISDSRIIATTAEWQQCMSVEGYLFADEDEMYSSVFERFNAILAEPNAFNEFDPADFPDADSDGGSNVHPGLTPAAQAEMDALGDDEKMIAIANWECREPIKDVELAVQREYENQFVTEVGPQVAELRGS